MSPLPSDPHLFGNRVMEALLGDLSDRSTNSFSRLDAMRAVKTNLRETRAAEKAAGSNHGD